MPGSPARAETDKVLPDVPRFKLFASSHSTAAAEVMAYHGVKKGLPQVVLIGGLEGRIYRCDCGKDIDLWDIVQGTRLWAAAEGLNVATEAKVLRGSSDRSPRIEPPIPRRQGYVGQVNADERRSLSASGGQNKDSAGSDSGKGQSSVTTASAGAMGPHGGDANDERLEFADYRMAIDEKQPVVLTYSLDAASDKDMEASFRSQERVSVVGVGYEEGDTGRDLIALLPQDWAKEKRFERLMALPGVKRGDREGLLLIPWELTTGNLIATFVTVEGQ